MRGRVRELFGQLVESFSKNEILTYASAIAFQLVALTRSRRSRSCCSVP
jgi:uncharacterized BrkB/YihY/UPF0761 family membrane protein